MNKKFEFKLTISGYGNTEEEAWQNAVAKLGENYSGIPPSGTKSKEVK